jgi:hypothetical protein
VTNQPGTVEDLVHAVAAGRSVKYLFFWGTIRSATAASGRAA